MSRHQDVRAPPGLSLGICSVPGTGEARGEISEFVPRNGCKWRPRFQRLPVTGNREQMQVILLASVTDRKAFSESHTLQTIGDTEATGR